MEDTASYCKQQYPLKGEVHTDEFLIGEYEEASKNEAVPAKKRLAIIALEVLTDGNVGRAYAQVIDSASAKEFKLFFNAYISKEANIVTDEWRSYLLLMKKYPKLKQVPSNKEQTSNNCIFI